MSDRYVDKTRVERVFPIGGVSCFGSDVPLSTIIAYIRFPDQDASPACYTFAATLDAVAPLQVRLALRDRAIQLAASASEEHEGRRRGLIVFGVLDAVARFMGVTDLNMEVTGSSAPPQSLTRVGVLFRHLTNSLVAFRSSALHEGERAEINRQIDELWAGSLRALDEALSVGPMGCVSKDDEAPVCFIN